VLAGLRYRPTELGTDLRTPGDWDVLVPDKGVHTPNPRPESPPAFKAEAIRLGREQGNPNQTAKDLEISLEKVERRSCWASGVTDGTFGRPRHVESCSRRAERRGRRFTHRPARSN